MEGMMSKKRVQYIFNDEMIEAVEQLKEDYSVNSNAQAIRQAVILARWLNKQIREGRKIQSIKGEDIKELALPLFGM